MAAATVQEGWEVPLRPYLLFLNGCR